MYRLFYGWEDENGNDGLKLIVISASKTKLETEIERLCQERLEVIAKNKIIKQENSKVLSTFLNKNINAIPFNKSKYATLNNKITEEDKIRAIQFMADDYCFILEVFDKNNVIKEKIPKIMSCYIPEELDKNLFTIKKINQI